MHDGDVHAALFQSVRRLQPQEAAADHHRVPEPLRGVDHGVNVLDVPEGNDTRQIMAGNGQHKGIGTGGQQQSVVRFGRAVIRNHLSSATIDFPDRLAGMQRDSVFRIPGRIIEHDVVDGFLAGKYRRQQNAVVIAVRLGPEDGDVVAVGDDLEQFFQRAHPRHAVADQHQFFVQPLFHVGCLSLYVADP